VEIVSDGALKYLGRLPTQTVPSSWRDMKVINGFVYIGSEAPGHGLQIFDMRKVNHIFLHFFIQCKANKKKISSSPSQNQPFSTSRMT
jgi:hypothetical protein